MVEEPKPEPVVEEVKPEPVVEEAKPEPVVEEAKPEPVKEEVKQEPEAVVDTAKNFDVAGGNESSGFEVIKEQEVKRA